MRSGRFGDNERSQPFPDQLSMVGDSIGIGPLSAVCLSGQFNRDPSSSAAESETRAAQRSSHSNRSQMLLHDR